MTQEVTPLFSIIVTCFNKRDTIVRAIKSAVQQAELGHLRVEVIVVDDASTDGSREILTALNHPEVALLFIEQNQGALRAYLRGFARATGQYVVMLDGDDMLAPNSLAAIQAANLLQGEATCIRMEIAELTSDACHSERLAPKIKQRFSPAYWFAIMQNTGGTAYIFPRALLARLTGNWPDISVQDHILPGVMALHAKRFLKLDMVGYLMDSAVDSNSLSTQTPRIHRDRLISDAFIMKEAQRTALPRLPRFLLRLGTALRVKKLGRVYGASHAGLIKMVFGRAQALAQAREAVLSAIASAQADG